MDLVIKNGTVVTGGGMFRADVGIANGKITALAEKLCPEGTETVDAEGLLVLPGGVDAHTHLEMAFRSTVTSDSYESGTRAAVCGGVTTVFDYPTQRKGTGIVQTVEERLAMAEGRLCSDIAFHCAVTDLGEKGELLDEFRAAADFGVTSFKCYTVYKREGLMVDDGTLTRIMEKASENGILTNVHCENSGVIDARAARYLAEGKTSPWWHYMSRPEFVEAEAVRRVLYLAKAVGAGVYIVHIAAKESVEALAEARLEGGPVFGETCPQYLEFTNSIYQREDARNFVCSPPIKGEESREALWNALKTGVIDTVATDHCPFKQAEKDWGLQDFTKIPNGCPGVENRYPYMLSAANEGKLSFERVVELCAEAPARIFGCIGKGSITIGKDADIVLYDPKKPFSVSVKNMHSEYDQTIWEGLKLQGYPVKTFLRGALVYDNGVFTGKKGAGRYIKRAASGL